MNTDIRLKVGFFDHPKTIKLQRRHGPEAIVALLRLWLWASQYRNDGTFNGMTGEDIEIAAGWPFGDCILVKALVEIGFLEEKDGHYSIHDWEKHNPYAFHAEERSRVARENIEKRWKNKKNNVQNTNGITDCITEGNTPSPDPSPDPSPSLKSKTTPAKTVLKENLSFDEVRNLYRDVFRDMLPSTTVCQQLSWVAETFDKKTIIDAFTGASSVKAKSLNYILKPLREKLEGDEAEARMWAEMGCANEA